MTKKLNILLADDHDYYLDGLQFDIEKIKNINNIFRANNGYEILEIVEKNKIDILISDIEMPELDGIKAAMKIRETNKTLKIIFLTSHYDIQHIKPLLKLDVKVILDKENVKKEILEAINAILNDEIYYTKLIKNTVNDILKGKRKTIKNTTDYDKLTRREKFLFPYFAKALSNNKIAKEVLLSPKTVEAHRRNIYFKFEVHSAAELLAKALKYGLIE